MEIQRLYPGDIYIKTLGSIQNRELYNKMNKKKDKYVKRVRKKYKKRSEVGIKKYNTTLERRDLNFKDWLNHLQEELMDATLYIERLKDSYDEIANQSKEGLGE